MIRPCVAVSMLVMTLSPASGAENGCPDLSGDYGFFGTWEQQSFEGGQSESIAAYIAAHPEPRLDRSAFAIFARDVVNPRIAVLRHDLATGDVELDVIGDAVRPRGEISGPLLPVSLPMICNGAEWVRERVASGGGENTLSEQREWILLWVESNGDLLAQGHSETTMGWIFKRRILSDWLARFRRTDQDARE
ncbi:hypothetical protein [Halomonas sp. YLGW01]|uniref:hypothetical protein n=1 Tax=Halomonas sp. YLGW01 TaxID=2773308 RepID=UPI001A932AB2|nr:hypothetical protein [Halomonas sp. YLGW01]